MKKLILLFTSLILVLTSCSPKATPTSQATAAPQATEPPQTLTVMTHDSFAVSEDVVKAFEEANNTKVIFLQSGDAGEVLNKAILTKDAPLADVLFGVDNTFLSRALDADIYDVYQSPALNDVPAEFKLDPSNRAVPIDYGDVCINYDKKYFADKNLAVPQTLEDLLNAGYKGLLVVENPATSSTGLAFLLATIAHFGDSFPFYWRSLKENGLVVVDGWETAYYTNFSGSSGHGPQPLVVSYATSPAAEVMLSEKKLDEAPTASILGPDTCFRQIEFVGILKGTKQHALAEKFVDFMLSKQFQEDMPAQMFVYPVNPNAALPEAFSKYSQVPTQSATLDPQVITEKRDAWIQAWTDVVTK